MFHIAALVGPYHPQELYYKVNYEGTLNVIDACKTLGIRKIVMSSSPSTRFDGKDINGLREDQLSIRPKGQFLQVRKKPPHNVIIRVWVQRSEATSGATDRQAGRMTSRRHLPAQHHACSSIQP